MLRINRDTVLSKTILNSFLSVVQVIFQGGVYFFLYRYLIKEIGNEALGLWSLIIATTSSANIANLGVSASIVPYIANKEALKEKDKIIQSISTAFAMIFFLMGLVSLFYAKYGIYLMSDIIPAKYLEESQRLIGISSGCLFLNSIGSVYLSSLEGMHRLYLKSLIGIFSNVIFLLSIFILTPQYGLLGTVYAQLVQSVFVFVSALFCLVYLLRETKIKNLFLIFNFKVAKNLLKVGYKFQIISLTLLFFDPLTKYLLTRFGGLSLVTFYEMANRLILQVRSVIVMACQSLVPMVSNYTTLGINLFNVYEKVIKGVFYLAIASSFGLSLSSSFISQVWIGDLNDNFILFLNILVFGWFFNIISSPLYFINIGVNKVNENMISHILLFLVNGIFGAVLGGVFGGRLVVWGVSLSLVISSLFLIISSAKRIPFTSYLGSTERILVVVFCFLQLITVFYDDFFTAINNVFLLLLGVIIFILIMFYYLYNTKVLKDLYLHIKSAYF